MTNFDFTNTPGLEAFIHKQIASAVEAEREKAEKRIKELEAALEFYACGCGPLCECVSSHDTDTEMDAVYCGRKAQRALNAARSAIKAEGGE